MEAMAVLWTPFDEPIPWAPPQVPHVTISTTDGWTSKLSFSVSGVPSNPNIESCPGCAAPSVQAVVTLNLTSYSNLTYLLAGLLDNSTGVGGGQVGVNGSFLDVTDFLPSLGLAAPVMSALANVVPPNGGIFGAPVSVATPPAPSCSGFGCLWSAVTSTVASVVGAITSIVAETWGFVVAAAEFVDQLAVGLADIVAKGAQWVAQNTVSGLEKIGTALETALWALLAYIIAEAKTFLTSALNFVFSSVNNAVPQMSAEFDPIAFNFWLPIQQFLMEAIVVAPTIYIVGAVLTAVAPPSGPLLAGLVIGLFVSVVLSFFAFEADPLVAGLQERLVWDADGLVNATEVGPPGSKAQQSDQPGWDDLAQIASQPQAGFIASGLGLALLRARSGQVGIPDAFSFGLSVLGLGFTWYFVNHPGNFLSAGVSVLVDTASLITDLILLGNPAGKTSGPMATASRVVDGVSLAMDTGSLLVDFDKWTCTISATC